MGENEYVYVSEGKGQGAFGEFKLLTNSQNEHEVPMNVSYLNYLILIIFIFLFQV